MLSNPKCQHKENQNPPLQEWLFLLKIKTSNFPCGVSFKGVGSIFNFNFIIWYWGKYLGCPKKRWPDNIKSDMAALNRDPHSWPFYLAGSCQNRKASNPSCWEHRTLNRAVSNFIIFLFLLFHRLPSPLINFLLLW